MPLRRVDVIIPTRNRSDLVVDAVLDGLDQVDVDSRCIVVDDGSEDHTASVVRSLDPDRVRLVQHERQMGLSAARNSGVAASDAPWVAFLDDDDRWAPTKLSDQFQALTSQQGARWATTGCVTTDANLTVIGAQELPGGGGDVFERLLIDCFIPAGGSSVLAERALLAEVGGFDTHLGAVEDWDMWLRMARIAPLAYVHRPLVAYRRWSGNMSNSPRLMRENRRMVLSRYESTRGSSEMAASHDLQFEQWMARTTLQEGRRWQSARRYTAVAVGGRSPGQLAYALAALVAPGLALGRMAARDRKLEPTGWRAMAEGWLRAGAVRQPPTPGGGRQGATPC